MCCEHTYSELLEVVRETKIFKRGPIASNTYIHRENVNNKYEKILNFGYNQRNINLN
jgi:hypothetical protein